MNKNTHYQDDLSIDKLSLDFELERQPKLIDPYQKLVANLTKQRYDLRLKLEIMEAEIDREIDREIRDKFPKKPTESEIKNMVIMDSSEYVVNVCN